eukprot:TRINITY_DN19475_c0_g1_i1.p1 TRINITY_DN19475_c0_g1~~TRINITY_DN19475_c0_g1_i1.p1  ORF type:complete len:433 (+),score=88.78 TRINITY_DN19475_c0_g1_i1:102-1301(+)
MENKLLSVFWRGFTSLLFSALSSGGEGHTPLSQLWHWQLYRTPDSASEFNFAEGKWRHHALMDVIDPNVHDPDLSCWRRRDAAFEAEGLFCNGRWLGVQVLQGPEDLMYLQQVIVRLRPSVIIESGTYRGGLAFFAASVLSQLGLETSRVITMDPFSMHNNFNNLDNHLICPVCMDCVKAYETEAWQKHVIFFEGNSLRLRDQVAQLVSELRGAGASGPVLLTLDAQHSFDATLTELHLYSGLVDVGSYIVLQDARLDLTYGRPGPMTAGAMLLKEHPPQWVWDRDVQVFGHTQHLWLRRVALGPPVQLSFHFADKDLVSDTPFQLKASGSVCTGSAPLKEVDWAGGLLTCQAICLRVPDEMCSYIEFWDQLIPTICVLRQDCGQLQHVEGGPLVYERF